jgi:hypothetical protein
MIFWGLSQSMMGNPFLTNLKGCRCGNTAQAQASIIVINGHHEVVDSCPASGKLPVLSLPPFSF